MTELSASVRSLPQAISTMAPELVELSLPEETRADCGNCPMAGQPFHRSVRCCTYEPAVPNFLVGRALMRADTGSARMLQRIGTGVGLGPLGVQPTPEWTAEYTAKRETDFGRNPDWKCPYWVEGPLSCSIWRDRNAVCRSWHCKHTEGFRGHRLWSAVRKLAAACEQRLSAWCASLEVAPDTTDAGKWTAYFHACARRVDSATAEDLAALGDPKLAQLRDAVRVAFEALREPIPDVLGVEVRGIIEHGDQIELVGYTPWNTARFPRAVFALLSQFDGERSRQEAVKRACEANDAVKPAWVRTLWDTGVLRGRDEHDDMPWGFGGPDLTPEGLVERFERS